MKTILSLIVFFALGAGNSFAQPSNDYCQNAITLTPNSSCSYYPGTTYNATESQPIPTSGWCSYITSTYAYDVWYKFTATCPDHHVKVQGASDFAAVVEIEDAACGSYLYCDAGGTGDMVDISVSCTVGNTYYIRVFNDYNFSLWSTGTNFDICVTPSCASNDDCSFAKTLTSGINCSYTPGTTIGATQSKPPVQCPGYISPYAAYDVWYKFTALNSSHKVKVLGASDFEPIVVVESSGCSSTSGWCEDGLVDGASVLISLTGLVIGTSYYIRVYDFNSYGSFQICVTHDGNTGTEEINSFPDWNIFPNPSSGSFTLSVESLPDETVQIKVLNIIGEEIYVSPIEKTGGLYLKEVSLPDADKGIYLVQVKIGEKMQYAKLILE